MAKPKVTKSGDAVVVSIPMKLLQSTKKRDKMFADAISEWEGKGYTLAHNSRVGFGGGSLTFSKRH
jgi:hypothetical protein